MNDSDHQELLAEVASLYYEKELSQVQIGEQLGLSRVKVYRLLKEARDEQIVQIHIQWPIERDSRLEGELVKRFHLDRALVIKTGVMTYELALRRLGQMVARYLEATLQNGMTLSISLGQSTYEVVHAIRTGFRANIHVAQAMGSVLSTNRDLDSSSLVRQLAQKLGGQFFYLPSPIMANSPAAAAVILDQPMIARTLDLARHADIALVGISGVQPEFSHYVKNDLIPAAELLRMGTEGLVGDMSGKFITKTGELFDCVYNQCIIGISLDDLKQIPNTIAVALGEHKISGMLGALHTGAINTLCTDSRTAIGLLSPSDIS